MQIPLHITFKNMHYSDAVELVIQDKAAKLEPFAPYISTCNVIVESSTQLGENKLYSVTVDVSLLDEDISASRHPSENYVNDDICQAIREAFEAEYRQLEYDLRHHLHQTQKHKTKSQGHISQLFPYDDYGLIKTWDGREIYFHRDNVLNEEYDGLAIGDGVQFKEELSDEGPEAVSITIEHRHHLV